MYFFRCLCAISLLLVHNVACLKLTVSTDTSRRISQAGRAAMAREHTNKQVTEAEQAALARATESSNVREDAATASGGVAENDGGAVPEIIPDVIATVKTNPFSDDTVLRSEMLHFVKVVKEMQAVGFKDRLLKMVEDDVESKFKNRKGSESEEAEQAREIATFIEDLLDSIPTNITEQDPASGRDTADILKAAEFISGLFDKDGSSQIAGVPISFILDDNTFSIQRVRNGMECLPLYLGEAMFFRLQEMVDHARTVSRAAQI